MFTKIVNERILELKEISEDGFDGYRIKTNKRIIEFLISNLQNCCEYWGYISTPDDVSQFIGATLKDISEIKSSSIRPDNGEDMYDGETVFLNLETSNGLLQLNVYNEHNGYYAHRIKLSIDGEIQNEDYI